AVLTQFEVATHSVSDQDVIDKLVFLKSVVRRAEYGVLHTIAQLDSDGVILERGMRTAPAVADLLRCTRAEARRLVGAAASAFPTSLAGEALEPRLPATAADLRRPMCDAKIAPVVLGGDGQPLDVGREKRHNVLHHSEWTV